MTRDEYWDETLRDKNTEVDEVLLKPFAPEDLLKAIRRMTGQKIEKADQIMKLPFA